MSKTRSRIATALLAMGLCGLWDLSGLVGVHAPQAALAHGEMHEQIQALTRQIESEPAGSSKLPFLYFQRGELHRLHGAWKQAEADFDMVERLDPERRDDKLRDLDLARGRLYLDWNRPAQAKKVLDRYLERHSNNPEALMSLAKALVELGWGINAVTHLDRAIAQHPQPEPDHFLARADILEKLGPKHLSRAVRGLDEGIRRLGPIVTLHSRAIDLEIKLKRWSSALARVDVLTKQMPRKDIWLARRADILELAGRRREARQARQQAVDAIDRLPPSVREQTMTAELRMRLVQALEQQAR